MLLRRKFPKFMSFFMLTLFYKELRANYTNTITIKELNKSCIRFMQ